MTLDEVLNKSEFRFNQKRIEMRNQQEQELFKRATEIKSAAIKILGKDFMEALEKSSEVEEGYRLNSIYFNILGESFTLYTTWDLSYFYYPIIDGHLYEKVTEDSRDEFLSYFRSKLQHRRNCIKKKNGQGFKLSSLQKFLINFFKL